MLHSTLLNIFCFRVDEVPSKATFIHYHFFHCTVTPQQEYFLLILFQPRSAFKTFFKIEVRLYPEQGSTDLHFVTH